VPLVSDIINITQISVRHRALFMHWAKRLCNF